VTVPEIDVEELAARLDAGAVLVDVRQPDEYEAGHVPTARLVPLDHASCTRATRG
jgi:rhodanese-related sulfurtransferase